MRVLEIVLFKFLLGYALQSFTIFLGLYAFNKRKIVLKKYVIASLILTVITYVTRLLPISFGVHTILDFVAAFLLGILFLKLPVLTTIKSVLIIFAIILVLDIAGSMVLSSILGQAKLIALMNDDFSRSLVALPSTLLSGAIYVIIYIIYNQKAYKEKQII